MSSKKKTNRFRGKLRKTMSDEKGDVEERFSRADVALGSAQNEAKSSSAGTRKKVIRDNFSMPEEDYALIEEIRQRLLKEHAVARNKSEVLRAGLLALAEMNSSELAEAIDRVKALKPGRKAQKP
jgi:hypothetical protein